MDGNVTIETERQVVNGKLWAVLTELENGLPLSQVTLDSSSRHYRFTVFRPHEGVVPIAVELTVQQGAVHVMAIRGKAT